jgi:hypothetical protein
MYHLKVKEDGTTSCAIIDETTKIFFLSSGNFINSILITFRDVASFSNVVGFYNISRASSSQQPKIDVQVINLNDFLGTKSSPLDFPPKLFTMFTFMLF